MLSTTPGAQKSPTGATCDHSELRSAAAFVRGSCGLWNCRTCKHHLHPKLLHAKNHSGVMASVINPGEENICHRPRLLKAARLATALFESRIPTGRELLQLRTVSHANYSVANLPRRQQLEHGPGRHATARAKDLRAASW